MLNELSAHLRVNRRVIHADTFYQHTARVFSNISFIIFIFLDLKASLLPRLDCPNKTPMTIKRLPSQRTPPTTDQAPDRPS